MAAQRMVVGLGILTGFLTIACLALAGVLVWREFFTPNTSAPNPSLVSLNATNRTEVRVKFPGYFRTPREQYMLEMANRDMKTPQPVTNVSSKYRRCFVEQQFCDLDPKKVQTRTVPPTSTVGPVYARRKKRQVQVSNNCSLDVYNQDELTFHACCVSYSSLENVTSLMTAEPGQTGYVEIAQFPNLKQFFEIQQCCQASGCTGCQCAQTYYVTSAVVVKKVDQNTYYKTEFVRVPGCCKCLNAVFSRLEN